MRTLFFVFISLLITLQACGQTTRPIKKIDTNIAPAPPQTVDMIKETVTENYSEVVYDMYKGETETMKLNLGVNTRGLQEQVFMAVLNERGNLDFPSSSTELVEISMMEARVPQGIKFDKEDVGKLVVAVGLLNGGIVYQARITHVFSDSPMLLLCKLLGEEKVEIAKYLEKR